ncbi:hypothetical protein JTE90_004144 [Oedothorax gibbosus]|uniref:Uncharacterized protein n=1 Tax=Oedothorax gibbosus TaxID=931172 RepID=A0AAV6TFM4_9ARAC|nr:hypothetical protein JTE90_004144 [Oedothorax gibbosus]
MRSRRGRLNRRLVLPSAISAYQNGPLGTLILSRPPSVMQGGFPHLNLRRLRSFGPKASNLRFPDRLN